MSNLVILAVYHFSRSNSGQRLLLEPETSNEKKATTRLSFWRTIYTWEIWSLNAVLDGYLNLSKVIQEFSTKTDKGYL